MNIDGEFQIYELRISKFGFTNKSTGTRKNPDNLKFEMWDGY